MLLKSMTNLSPAALLIVGLVMIATPGQSAAEEKAAAPQKPVIAKLCTNCHQPQAGSLRGSFESISPKSIQIKIDDAAEVLKYDPGTIKLANMPAGATLRDIKKNKELRIEYTEKGGVKTATLLSLKPEMKVPADKLMTTADIEKLTALGPEQGKYLLVDARPAPKFQEGAIPTAVNIPFPSYDAMTAKLTKDMGRTPSSDEIAAAVKLPKEKNSLIIFYCAGVT